MLTRWNPFVDWYNREHDAPLGVRQSQRFQPAVDVLEREGAFDVQIEMPGVDPDDVDIKLDGTRLSITGERKHEEVKQNEGYQWVERNYGSFTRSFTLPENVDPDKIEASMEKGVLTVHIPKSQKSQPRRIGVRGASRLSAKPEQKEVSN